MAVRRPLKLDGGNIREMTIAEVDAIKAEATRQYGLDPSSTITVNSGGGTERLWVDDTRLQAGAATSDATDFDTEAETPDVETVTVTYKRMILLYEAESEWLDNDYSYPLYYDNGDLREMTPEDFADTFITSQIDELVNASSLTTAQAGTYFISQNPALSTATLVGGPVFVDTRADEDAYDSAGIPEDQDQPITIQSYYLYRINPAAEGSYARPLIFTKAGFNLQAMPKATLQDSLQTMIRHYARGGVAGHTIDYYVSTLPGGGRGSAMVNTQLSGSRYLTNLVGDDYRTQEVPDGDGIPGYSSTNQLLKIRKV